MTAQPWEAFGSPFLWCQALDGRSDDAVSFGVFDVDGTAAEARSAVNSAAAAFSGWHKVYDRRQVQVFRGSGTAFIVATEQLDASGRVACIHGWSIEPVAGPTIANLLQLFCARHSLSVPQTGLLDLMGSLHNSVPRRPGVLARALRWVTGKPAITTRRRPGVKQSEAVERPTVILLRASDIAKVKTDTPMAFSDPDVLFLNQDNPADLAQARSFGIVTRGVPYVRLPTRLGGYVPVHTAPVQLLLFKLTVFSILASRLGATNLCVEAIESADHSSNTAAEIGASVAGVVNASLTASNESAQRQQRMAGLRIRLRGSEIFDQKAAEQYLADEGVSRDPVFQLLLSLRTNAVNVAEHGDFTLSLDEADMAKLQLGAALELPPQIVPAHVRASVEQSARSARQERWRVTISFPQTGAVPKDSMQPG